jgi:hypothetical protein
MSRWAAKQRNAWKIGQLDPSREALLVETGFEFNVERAEWMRWFNELRVYKERHGDMMPLAVGQGKQGGDWGRG